MAISLSAQKVALTCCRGRRLRHAVSSTRIGDLPVSKINLHPSGGLGSLQLIGPLKKPKLCCSESSSNSTAHEKSPRAVPSTINLQRPAFRFILQLVTKPESETSTAKAGSSKRTYESRRSSGQRSGPVVRGLVPRPHKPGSGTSDLCPDGLLGGVVHGGEVGHCSVKRPIQCSIEHRQCVWIIGRTRQWHRRTPSKRIPGASAFGMTSAIRA